MGLFDFLSRKKEQADGAGASGNDPRCDHYTFIHLVLRQTAFDDPMKCVSTLGSPACDEYLAQLWESVKETCEEYSQPVELSPSDIMVHRLRIGDHPCALIEMPTPAAPGEVFYAALVINLNPSDRTKGFSDRPVRFITLEETGRGGGALTTVLGEWISHETHISHGPGPYPSIDEFIAKVTELITDRKKL